MSIRTNRAICEAVEARRHLTAAMVAGTNSSDVIRMTATDSTIIVEVNGFPQSYPTAVYNSVIIQAVGGADHIFIDSDDGFPVTVDGGGADDDIHLADASQNLDDLSANVSVFASSGNDTIFLADDASASADTYSINNNAVTRNFFGGLSYSGSGTIRLATGDGADTINAYNTNSATLIVDGQGGDDVLNINPLGNGAATVNVDTAQDFANVQSTPGGNLNLLGNASMVLNTNLSNFEGNVTLGTGFIVERNSKPADGLGYWRQRLTDGTTATTPSLISTYAASSAVADAIGYGYAQNLTITSVGGVTLNTNDLLLRYTLKGDANLDGTVTFQDLVALAQNYNNGTGKDWTQGDFDLSRTVNFSDLVPLAQNYNQTAPTAIVDPKHTNRRAALNVLA